MLSASDNRLKFNERPLVNAFEVIGKLEPVEYGQAFDLVYQYTPETLQTHQRGDIAQPVEKFDELKHVVEGGVIGEDGQREPARDRLQRGAYIC